VEFLCKDQKIGARELKLWKLPVDNWEQFFRARRRKKSNKLNPLGLLTLRKIESVITYPEITKNASTPANPPGIPN
jgi:hypothetical protein